MFDKLKKLADQAKEKAGTAGRPGRAEGDRAGRRGQGEGRPAGRAGQGTATELASKAAPAVSQGVDKAAGSIDKATRGRFSGQLDKVQDVVHDTASKVADRGAAERAAGHGS